MSVHYAESAQPSRNKSFQKRRVHLVGPEQFIPMVAPLLTALLDLPTGLTNDSPSCFPISFHKSSRLLDTPVAVSLS